MSTHIEDPAHSPDQDEAVAYYIVNGYPQITSEECLVARKIVRRLQDYPKAELITKNENFLGNLQLWCSLIKTVGLPTVGLDQTIGNCNLEISQIKPIIQLYKSGIPKVLMKLKTDRQHRPEQDTERPTIKELIESNLNSYRYLFDRKQLVGRLYRLPHFGQSPIQSQIGLICIGKGGFDIDRSIRGFAPLIRYGQYPNIFFSSCTLEELEREIQVLRISYRPVDLQDHGNRFIALACLLQPELLSFPGADPKDLTKRLEELRLQLIEKSKYDKFLRLILAWGLQQISV